MSRCLLVFTLLLTTLSAMAAGEAVAHGTSAIRSSAVRSSIQTTVTTNNNPDVNSALDRVAQNHQEGHKQQENIAKSLGIDFDFDG